MGNYEDDGERVPARQEFAVVLMDYDRAQQSSVIQAVRQYAGGSVAAARALLAAAVADPAGRIIATRIPASEIAEVQAHLTRAGARVQLMDSSYMVAESPAQRQDLYDAAVFAALRLPAELPPPSQGTAYRVLFQPTFHPYTCITLDTYEDRARIEMVVAREGLAYSLLPRVGESGPCAGVAQATRAGVPPAAHQRFSTAFEGDSPWVLTDPLDWSGRDGIAIRLDMRAGATRHTIHFWSPSPTEHPVLYRFCQTILAVAQASLPGAPEQKVLQDMQRYFT